MPLGPFSVEFDEEAVRDFLFLGASPESKECLRNFFQDIQRKERNVPFAMVGTYFVVEVCDYILHLRILVDDGTRTRVEGICDPEIIGAFRMRNG
jgi:hypothetical protein